MGHQRHAGEFDQALVAATHAQPLATGQEDGGAGGQVGHCGMAHGAARIALSFRAGCPGQAIHTRSPECRDQQPG